MKGLFQHWNTSRDYLITPLFGRIKGERFDLLHLIPCAHRTKSGLDIYVIINRLLSLKQGKGFINGQNISGLDGKLLSIKTLNDMLHQALKEIYVEKPNLFPLSIDHIDKIAVNYQCFRTLRRTSTTRATEEGVSETDINIVNKWRPPDEIRGPKSKSTMHQHNTQFDLLVKPFLRYTSKM